jgi:hypothetical protein
LLDILMGELGKEDGNPEAELELLRPNWDY